MPRPVRPDVTVSFGPGLAFTRDLSCAAHCRRLVELAAVGAYAFGLAVLAGPFVWSWGVGTN